MQSMEHRLKTLAGKAAHALRKQTVEPVFGIIKSVMGFGQFSLRGLRKVTGEWSLELPNPTGCWVVSQFGLQRSLDKGFGELLQEAVLANQVFGVFCSPPAGHQSARSVTVSFLRSSLRHARRQLPAKKPFTQNFLHPLT